VLFDWQSNSDIRKYFHNPEPVKWQQHCDWLKSTLADDHKHLYMVKSNDSDKQNIQPVGVLRLDALENSKYELIAGWEISIIISPEHQGRKIAEKAIRQIPEPFKNQGIIAEVHHDNSASHKLFLRSGFVAISPLTYCLKNEKRLGKLND